MNYKRSDREEKSKETREKIFNSAYQLFNSKYDEFTVDMIVKHAGVAKGSFYVHFESKEALIQQLISDYVKKIDSDYEAYLKALPDDMPILDIILSMVGKISDVITDTIGYDKMNTLYKVQLSEAANYSAVSDYNRDIYKIFSYLITTGCEKGEFSENCHVDSITRHVMISFRGLVYEWCLRFPAFNLKEEALTHYQYFFNGLMNR